MKGFIIASSVFISISIALIFYNIYIINTFTDISTHLELIEESIEADNFKKAMELTLSFEKELSENSHLLYTLTDRAPIDTALSECARLSSFIKVCDKAESLASASGIRKILEKNLEKSVLRIKTAKNTAVGGVFLISFRILFQHRVLHFPKFIRKIYIIFMRIFKTKNLFSQSINLLRTVFPYFLNWF